MKNAFSCPPPVAAVATTSCRSCCVPVPLLCLQMIDMENLLQLLDTPGKVVDAPNATDLQLAEGAVEFRDVMFGYERGVPVLKGVSGVGNSSSSNSISSSVGLLV